MSYKKKVFIDSITNFEQLNLDQTINFLSDYEEVLLSNEPLTRYQVLTALVAIKSIALSRAISIPKKILKILEEKITQNETEILAKDDSLADCLLFWSTMIDCEMYNELYSKFQTLELFNSKYLSNNVFAVMLCEVVLCSDNSTHEEKVRAFNLLEDTLENKFEKGSDIYTYSLCLAITKSVLIENKSEKYIRSYKNYEAFLHTNYMSDFYLKLGEIFYSHNLLKESLEMAEQSKRLSSTQYTMQQWRVLALISKLDLRSKQLTLPEQVFHLMFPDFNKILKGEMFKGTLLGYVYVNAEECREISQNEARSCQEKNVLDLVSGLWRKNENEVIQISPKRVEALIAIVSFGMIGVKELTLAEYVFIHENISIKSYMARVQDLITQLQKMGFPILRKDNFIYFRFDQFNAPILMNRGGYLGMLHFFVLRKTSLTRDCLMSNFKIGRSTANLYLKTWLKSGLIKPDSSRYGSYEVVSIK